jgi:hypothetical protein
MAGSVGDGEAGVVKGSGRQALLARREKSPEGGPPLLFRLRVKKELSFLGFSFFVLSPS